MATSTIPMVNAVGMYSKEINSSTYSIVHVKYDSSNTDAIFSIAYSRSQVNYLPGSVVIFKKSGDSAPTFVDTHGSGSYVTQVNSVTKESSGFYVTFNIGNIRGIISGNVPFSLSYS